MVERRRRRSDPGAAARMRAMRARRKSALVYDPSFAGGEGGWVRPDPHPPSDYSYTISGCAHCRPVHTAAAQNRAVGTQLGARGDAETDVLSLTSLTLTERRVEIDAALPPLAVLARHKLDAAVRSATIPPPPPPNAASRPRHRRST